MTSPLPKVSVLIPTRDRRAWLPRVFHHLARQDHPADRLEVLVFDDGRDRVDDLVPDDPRFRYEHVGARIPLGTKRNLLCEAATGDVFLHMDDDDWQPADRISRAVAALDGGDGEVVGRTVVAVWDLLTDRLHTTPSAGDKHAMAGTLAYTRAFWTTHPWANDARDEERQFLRNFVAPMIQLPGAPHETLVALHHGDNARIRTAPLPAVDTSIDAWLPQDDVDFYRSVPRDDW